MDIYIWISYLVIVVIVVCVYIYVCRGGRVSQIMRRTLQMFFRFMCLFSFLKVQKNPKVYIIVYFVKNLGLFILVGKSLHADMIWHYDERGMEGNLSTQGGRSCKQMPPYRLARDEI